VFYVDFGGSFADAQGVGDLLVGLAGGEEREDFCLAGRERFDREIQVGLRGWLRLVLFLVGQAA
jgi:hypothetical protein